MADEKNKKKTENAAPEQKPATPAPATAKSSGGSPIMIALIAAGILLGLGGLGGGGYFLYAHMQAAKAAAENVDPNGDAPEITETNIYFDEFPEGIVNLQITDKCPFTYLKYAFSVEVENPKVLEELKTKLPRLTSKIQEVMSNRAWDDISPANGREQLAKEAMAAINSDLEEGKAIGLFFKTFVAQ